MGHEKRTAIYLLASSLPPPLAAQLSTRCHWVLPTKCKRCHVCAASVVLFWKKRNCYLCGNVVCAPCRQYLLIEQPGSPLEARVCRLCLSSYFSHHTPITANSALLPSVPSAPSPVLPVMNEKASQEPLLPPRHYQPRAHHRSVQRPTRKSAFDSPRRESTPKKKRIWPYAWCPPPTVPNEVARLEALSQLKVLDTPPEDVFEVICTLAATTYACPIAGVTFVDATRQWFKAAHGLKQREISRKVAFCGHTLAQRVSLVVLDAVADDRFSKNPLVTGPAAIRFFASAPIVADAHVVGTVLVADTRPRPTFDPADLEALARALERMLRERATASTTPVRILNSGVDAAVLDRLARTDHWAVGSAFVSCQVCAKEFNYFRHRQHCHLCGDVVCGGCLERVTIERPSRCPPRYSYAQKLESRVCKCCFVDTFHGQATTILATETCIRLYSAYGPTAETNAYYYPQASHQFNATLRLPPALDGATSTARISALAAYDEIETQREERCDILITLARTAYKVPIAVVTLLQADGFVHFQAHTGWAIDRMAATDSLCSDVLATGCPIVLLNASNEGFKDHQFVAGPPHLQFYASVPVIVAAAVIGTIVVADTLPRQRCNLGALLEFARIAATILSDTA
ncbi:hypothetical protein ACHHYP_02291 [Achlya hypogyna]|uniref:FYVE-type domain-containing protein n=1 Tax=Achlya hypogyna TaxID=1202772 RepID=A0A1V9Z788_ACHHY|nr:hypothetical protein ACHHYP_02291 [Achlya hypogyna]